MSKQMEMISLEALMPKDHNYRKFKELWDLSFIQEDLGILEAQSLHQGYGLYRLFLCLLIQFMEDLSDRELASYMQENFAGKWFCGFSLSEKTPDHTVFTRARFRIGTSRLSRFFKDLKKQLKQQGYMSEVFTFIDASHLITKANLWVERDKVIKKKYDQLNNKTLPKIAYDKQAKIGCKGKNKYWYGYKKHVSVDMQSGMINKVAVTPANIIDSKGMKHVVPKTGALYADKGYCDKHAKKATAKHGLHLAALKKNNMRDKNKDLDRFYSKMRFPYERVFSKTRKRVRYASTQKNQFSAFMESMSII